MIKSKINLAGSEYEVYQDYTGHWYVSRDTLADILNLELGFESLVPDMVQQGVDYYSISTLARLITVKSLRDTKAFNLSNALILESLTVRCQRMSPIPSIF